MLKVKFHERWTAEECLCYGWATPSHATDYNDETLGGLLPKGWEINESNDTSDDESDTGSIESVEE
jgi:hypothetical protein